MTLIAVDSCRVIVNVCLDKMCMCVCRKIYSLVWEGGKPAGGWSKYTSEGLQWRKMGEDGGECKGDPISLGSVLPN